MTLASIQWTRLRCGLANRVIDLSRPSLSWMGLPDIRLPGSKANALGRIRKGRLWPALLEDTHA